MFEFTLFVIFDLKLSKKPYKTLKRKNEMRHVAFVNNLPLLKLLKAQTRSKIISTPQLYL